MEHIKLFEEYNQETITLYHGTCDYHAEKLLKQGWQPNQVKQGSNLGQTQYLYVSTEKEDALWFAEEKGCNIVLKIVDIPISYLKFDPEDGDADLFDYRIDVAIKKLNKGYHSPIKFVLNKPLGKNHFIKL